MFGRCVDTTSAAQLSVAVALFSLLFSSPSMAAVVSSTQQLTSAEMAALQGLLSASTPVLFLLERRLPRPSPAELQSIQEEHRQKIVSGILESVAAVGMASGAGLLLWHPFALIATAVVGAGALTGTVLVKLIWGTEDVNAAVIKAMASPFYSPTRQPQLQTAAATLTLLQRVAGRFRELPASLRSRLQRAEFDENIDVSLLDNGRLQAVVNDVNNFLRNAGHLPTHPRTAAASALSNQKPPPGPPAAASPPRPSGAAGCAVPSPASVAASAIQLEPACVSYVVSSIIERMLNKTGVDGRHRDAVTEVIVGPDALGLVHVAFDYKWDSKRSCLWRKVDLRIVRRVLWLTTQEDLRTALHSLVWEGPPPPPVKEKAERQPEVEQGEADTAEGEGAERAEVGGGEAGGGGELTGRREGVEEEGKSVEPEGVPRGPSSSDIHLHLTLAQDSAEAGNLP